MSKGTAGGGKALAVFAALKSRFSGFQVELLDSSVSSGAAHDGAHYQAENSRGNAYDGTCAAHVVAALIKGSIHGCTERSRRAGAADQRGGTCRNAESGILTKRSHQSAAQEVLQECHHGCQQQHDNDVFTAALQNRNADRETDGAEEYQHKEGLQRVVKRNGQHTACGEGRIHDSEIQTAYQRRGDTFFS